MIIFVFIIVLVILIFIKLVSKLFFEPKKTFDVQHTYLNNKAAADRFNISKINTKNEIIFNFNSY